MFEVMETNISAIRSGGKSSSKSSRSTARRDELVTRHFGLVDKVARRLGRKLPRHVDQDDLRSAGMIGLLEAAERFDPTRQEKFESFAEFRIRGAMLDDLRSRDSLSRDMRRVCTQLRDATAALANQLGRTPTEAELAAKLSISLSDVRERQAKLSGWSVVGLDDVGPSFMERTADENAPDPCQVTSERELFNQMIDQIELLPEKMQQVLALYYCEDLNLREIGQVLGVTESRVCQLHGEATKRLRGMLGESFAEQLAAA